MVVNDQDAVILDAVNLQLAGATTGRNGMLSLSQLYTNFRKYSEIDITYAEFIGVLENNRREFDVNPGQLGVDVSFVGLKN